MYIIDTYVEMASASDPDEIWNCLSNPGKEGMVAEEPWSHAISHRMLDYMKAVGDLLETITQRNA